MSLYESVNSGTIHIEVRGEQIENHLVLEFSIHSASDCGLHWGL